MDEAKRTREKRDHKGSEREKVKRERRVDLSSRTFSLLLSLSFFFLRCCLYFYALLDSSPSARRHFNWTEQSSSFPSSFEGCQPCIPKNHPFVFETLVLPSCNAPFFPPLDLLHLLEDSRVLERGNFNICFRSEIVCARTPALCARVYRTTGTASLEILKVRRKY